MSKELTFEMLVPETLLNWKRRALYAEARAQKMGALVEAVKELHHVAHKCLAVLVPSADGASEELSDAMRKVRVLLAEIEGK